MVPDPSAAAEAELRPNRQNRGAGWKPPPLPPEPDVSDLFGYPDEDGDGSALLPGR